MRGPVEPAPRVHGLGTDIVDFSVVHEDGRLALVDAGLPGYTKTHDDELRRTGRTRADVDAVVLTHSDADRTGMAPVLQPLPFDGHGDVRRQRPAALVAEARAFPT